MTKDSWPIIAAAIGTLLATSLAAFRLRAWIRNFLTPAEWLIYGKILVIVVCAVLLALTGVAGENAGEGFIYGNF